MSSVVSAARNRTPWLQALALALPLIDASCSSRSSHRGSPLDAGAAPSETTIEPPREQQGPALPSEPEPGEAEEMDSGVSEPAPPQDGPHCPPEMVRVARRYCVDRYEGSLVDAATGQTVSPYYPPSRRQATFVEKLW